MQDLLNVALAAHQAGDLTKAARLYRQILSHDADHADALHLLGLLHFQQGEHVRAVEAIGRAAALRPQEAAFHSNLAEAYRGLGQFEQAADCCRTALRLSPDYPEGFCNLGLALQGLGQHSEAAAQFRRAVQLRPNFANAHSNFGISLRELGRLAEAFDAFRIAVELDPHLPHARSNLGQILIDRGKADEALPHCREAVRLAPELAALHHNLGNAYRALDQRPEARAAYLEAIRLDPALAEAHAHLGLLLQQEGQLDDALISLQRAVELKGNDAQFWEHLAELHVDREDCVHAISCWERALALDPARATAHNGLGWALQEQGRWAEAGAHYREAMRLQPDFAWPVVNQGSLHEELGDLEAAEVAFREALRLRPDFAIPHARLATLLRGKLPDADLAALEARLADPRLGESPRARLLFGLAHVLDARGDYARAAECLGEANALALELPRRQKRAYRPAEHVRFVEGLLTAFDVDWFRRMATAGVASRRPVFIFGLPRSGTTLMEQVLASHPRVHGAGELPFGRQSFESIPAAVSRADGPLPSMRSLAPAHVRALAEKYLERLAVLDGGRSERVVDKMPDNYLYAGLLAAMFPRGIFIHCRRDLRDVALSCWMTDFRSLRWANDVNHIAGRIRQYRRLMDHWRAVLPLTVHEVAYEVAIADLESVARRLLEICELPWEPRCLEFHRTSRPIRTASVVQVRQPIYTRSVARWRNYEGDLASLFSAVMAVSQDGG